jgi:LPXTG-motif cell wall-anchored protein
VRENPLYEQYLRIIKTDADTGEAIPIAGAAFEILDASNNVLTDRNGNSVFYTDLTGMVDLSTLPLLVGTYGIRETVAPTGYAPSPEILHFTVAKTDHGTSLVTVEAGRDIRTVSIENRKISGVLEIYKLAADTQLPMQGVVFEVYDKDGNLVDTMTTDAEGKAKTKILPYGVYTLIETKTWTGYILADKSSFSIYQTPKDGETFSTTEMTLSNQKMGEIEVYKVTADGTSTPMNGVVFGVYDAKTDKEIARITTDKNGYGYIYILAGNYYLKEISTWPGYAVSTQKIAVTGVTNASLFTFRESNGFTTTKVAKTSTTGESLSGMQFSIADSTGRLVSMYYDITHSSYVALVSDKIKAPEGATIVTQGVTGPDGSSQVYGLLAGQSYLFSETAAPSGYYNDSKPITLTIGTDVLGVVRFVDSQIMVTAKTGETSSSLFVELGIGLAGLAVVAAVVLIYKKKHA